VGLRPVVSGRDQLPPSTATPLATGVTTHRWQKISRSKNLWQKGRFRAATGRQRYPGPPFAPL